MSHRRRYCTSLAITSIATTSLARCGVLVILLYTLSLVLISPGFAQTLVDGGLTAPVTGWSLSSNLLVNGDFSLGTTGWSFPSTCFGLDPTTPAPNGGASLELTNPGLAILAPADRDQHARRRRRAGVHDQRPDQDRRFQRRESARRRNVLLYDYNYSPVVNGTTDWTSATRQHVSVTAWQDRVVPPGDLRHHPTGNAWFANLSVQQEIPPGLQTFLLYPNYRGLMFSDQSQVVSMDLTVTPPSGTSLGALQVELDALDAGGNIVASNAFTPTATEFTGTLDMSALPSGSYQVEGKLEDSSGNVLMTQTPYTVVKLDASVRAGMKAWIDPANLAHFIDGNPHFVLGIYDTTGWSYAPASYVKELTAIAQAPINMIINYYLTNAPTPAITAYTTAMKSFGMTFLPTVNDFYTGNKNFPTALAAEFGTDDQDQLTSDYAAALSSDPGVVGYYVQDEPPSTDQPETFNQYSLLKGGDPSGFTLAVLDHPLDLGLWKDTVDVIGVDPYPLALASGNDIAEVADWTRAAYQAGHGARPVWTVIQFFQLTVAGAWPTQQQLHDMSWMAIVEGATGLFYWSYGVRALYDVTNAAEKAALYQELINVTTEIKSLEPVLLSPDAPVITANSAAGTVFTKTKSAATAPATCSPTTTPRRPSRPSSRWLSPPPPSSITIPE